MNPAHIRTTCPLDQSKTFPLTGEFSGAAAYDRGSNHSNFAFAYRSMEEVDYLRSMAVICILAVAVGTSIARKNKKQFDR
jgi:hypothetical protein